MTLRVLTISPGLAFAVVSHAAYANDFISAGDLTILRAPRMVIDQTSQASDRHADQGKSFAVECFISASGQLADCQAQAGHIHDAAP